MPILIVSLLLFDSKQGLPCTKGTNNFTNVPPKCNLRNTRSCWTHTRTPLCTVRLNTAELKVEELSPGYTRGAATPKQITHMAANMRQSGHKHCCSLFSLPSCLLDCLHSLVDSSNNSLLTSALYSSTWLPQCIFLSCMSNALCIHTYLLYITWYSHLPATSVLCTI